MKVELLSPRSERWASFIGRVRHDFYHLPAYVAASARTDGGEAGALLVEDGERELLLPILRRPIPQSGDRWDATTPYGYPGPIAGPSSDPAFVVAALEAAREWLRGEGCVSLFARLHPLLGVLPTGVTGTLVSHGETVYVDLRRSDEELWRDTMSGHRNEINRSIRAGHQALFDDDFRYLDRFVAVYRSTMERVGASAYYMFDRDYVVGLREALGRRLHLAVVLVGEDVAAAGLFVETCGIVQYHLSGTDERFIRERPTKLMLHHARAWAKARGNDTLHLGGGVGGSVDSLFKFKAGFSPLRASFHTLRVVTDDAAYRTLTRARHPDVDPTDLGGFFPAYRRP